MLHKVTQYTLSQRQYMQYNQNPKCLYMFCPTYSILEPFTKEANYLLAHQYGGSFIFFVHLKVTTSDEKSLYIYVCKIARSSLLQYVRANYNHDSCHQHTFNELVHCLYINCAKDSFVWKNGCTSHVHSGRLLQTCELI